MPERTVGTFFKSGHFAHCHKCGKRTLWRRYSNGFYTDRQGNRSAKVLSIPYCKAHDKEAVRK